jgi:hypothetical protein
MPSLRTLSNRPLRKRKTSWLPSLSQMSAIFRAFKHHRSSWRSKTVPWDRLLHSSSSHGRKLKLGRQRSPPPARQSVHQMCVNSARRLSTSSTISIKGTWQPLPTHHIHRRVLLIRVRVPSHRLYTVRVQVCNRVLRECLHSAAHQMHTETSLQPPHRTPIGRVGVHHRLTKREQVLPVLEWAILLKRKIRGSWLHRAYTCLITRRRRRPRQMEIQI